MLEWATLPERGTTVVLVRKDGEDVCRDVWKLGGLVRKYSDHVAFPIRMPKEAPAAEDNEGDDRKTDATPEWETANDASALWSRPKSEITDNEYQAFYKSLGHDFNDAAAWTHNRVEGSQSFTTLLYLPARPPFDLMMRAEEHTSELQSLMRTSSAVFCLKNKKLQHTTK